MCANGEGREDIDILCVERDATEHVDTAARTTELADVLSNTESTKIDLLNFVALREYPRTTHNGSIRFINRSFLLLFS